MKREEIELLKAAVERVLGQKVSKPTDFNHLSALVQHRTHLSVSTSTLKRLWGYVQGYESTRRSTLDILCQFLGYTDMMHFLQTDKGQDVGQSSKFFHNEQIFTDSLSEGSRLLLTWAPDRVCEVQYQGEGRFEVVRSQQCKLTEGCTFCCSVLEQGAPMFASNVRFASSPSHSLTYLAGLNGGIHYELLLRQTGGQNTLPVA